MLDYYSEFPGPTEHEAKRDFTVTLKPLLQPTPPPPPRLAPIINELIDESIDEGVDEAYVSYSASGWMVFGKQDCINAIMKIFKEKLIEETAKIKKDNTQKLAFGKNPDDVHLHIAQYMGENSKPVVAVTPPAVTNATEGVLANRGRRRERGADWVCFLRRRERKIPRS